MHVRQKKLPGRTAFRLGLHGGRQWLIHQRRLPRTTLSRGWQLLLLLQLLQMILPEKRGGGADVLIGGAGGSRRRRRARYGRRMRGRGSGRAGVSSMGSTAAAAASSSCSSSCSHPECVDGDGMPLERHQVAQIHFLRVAVGIQEGDDGRGLRQLIYDRHVIVSVLPVFGEDGVSRSDRLGSDDAHRRSHGRQRRRGRRS